MLYAAYQNYDDLMHPLRTMAGFGLSSLSRLGPGLHANGSLGRLSAAYELIARTRLTHSRPSFRIPSVQCGGRTAEVQETAVCTMPFGTLPRFAKEGEPAQPRVLVVAPLSLATLEWRGRKVNPRAIRRTALLTVEGEKDDICAVGQTLAAHDLCSGLRTYMKSHHMQAGVGHYGVFSGKRWAKQIYPIVRDLIQSHDRVEPQAA